MNIEYVQDIPIPDLYTLSRRDWLHPTHGPPPDILGQLAYDDHLWCCAIWLRTKALILAIDSITEDVPEFPGHILLTARWEAENNAEYVTWNNIRVYAGEHAYQTCAINTLTHYVTAYNNTTHLP